MACLILWVWGGQAFAHASYWKRNLNCLHAGTEVTIVTHGFHDPLPGSHITKKDKCKNAVTEQCDVRRRKVSASVMYKVGGWSLLPMVGLSRPCRSRRTSKRHHISIDNYFCVHTRSSRGLNNCETVQCHPHPVPSLATTVLSAVPDPVHSVVK
jgi:hypothetical protein